MVLQPLVLNAFARSEVMGSIIVCKVVSDNTVNAGAQFTINSIVPPISSVPAPVGTFGTSVFNLPLTYNADLLSDMPGNDAECRTYDNLPLGGYHYSQETIVGPGAWEAPKYNDQFTQLLSTVTDFFNWDGNLYDGNPANDIGRQENADGHLNLTVERPNRTIVVYNKSISDECGHDCITPTPTPSPTPTDTPTPTPTSGGCLNESNDCTPPVSAFDDTRNHQTVVDVELLPLTLSGTSIDDMSGVQSAELHIFKMADETLIDSQEYGAYLEGLNCTQHGEGINTEIVALSLSSVGALNTTWSYNWMPTERGIYCVEAHATDVAGNQEHTAFGGPISILVTPTPTPAPTPVSTPNPGCTSNCGGGGGGFIPPPLDPIVSAPAPSIAPQVLGITTLPATSTTSTTSMAISLFVAMITTGAMMLMIGLGMVPKKLENHLK